MFAQEGASPSSQHESHILITDIGSTTTKALLLTRDAHGYGIVADQSVPTTVEKPFEDVTQGVRAAVRALEQQTSLSLLDADRRPSVPYYATSSAGGGLQILVFGLTSVDTGKVAKLTAHAAGGVILHTFTVDDPTPTIHRMRMIRELHPDMILMAGGTDNGDIANLVRMAEILVLADPRPKFAPTGRLPLVFCGNPAARPFLAAVLEPKFDVHYANNIRPSLEELNPAPARDLVHKVFMETVMQRAPGYDTLSTWTGGEILPTPSAVERILQLYADRHAQSVVMVDVGGATTDVFSNIYGTYRRTVAANTGLSYSISNVLAEAGYERIAAHLPPEAVEADVRDYIANKTLAPTHVPHRGAEIAIEHAVATEGIALAWSQHREANFQVATLGFLDRLKRRKDIDPFEDAFVGIDLGRLFQVSDIGLLIGTGGVLSHAPRTADVVRMLVDGFQPSGITKLALDRGFRSPHLGLLAAHEPEQALDLYEREGLQELAYVVAPIGEIRPGEPVLRVEDRRTGRAHALGGGELLFLPEGGDLVLEAAAEIHITKHESRASLTTELAVLIDCRGRGERRTGPSLARGPIPELRCSADPLETTIAVESPQMREGRFTFRRSLPYPGEILVRPGDRVAADTVVGRNVFTPPRIYIVDMQRMVGYEHPLSPEEIRGGVLVAVGEDINAGKRIFRYPGGLLGGHFYCSSPVRGRVVHIEPNGMVILREIQDYSVKPRRVPIAKPLEVPPKQIRRYLKFEVGDFVQGGEVLARSSDKMFPVTAPTTGTLKEIDTAEGTVTLQYDLKPVELRSFVSGRVARADDRLYAEIEGHGTILYGRIGFGHENVGPLATLDRGRTPTADLAGSVLATFDPVDEQTLRACAAAGIAGLIAPSLRSIDWVAFSGREIGVALTGDEDIPFTLLLTEGFGRRPMNASYRTYLAQAAGRAASLSGRTQIRAGVVRPMAIFCA